MFGFTRCVRIYIRGLTMHEGLNVKSRCRFEFLGKIVKYRQIITNSMKQSHYLELSHLRNSPNFMEPEGSSPYSEEPATFPILSQIDSIHATQSNLLKNHFKIILPSTPGSFQVVSFPEVSPLKACVHLSSPPPPYILHALPISVFLT